LYDNLLRIMLSRKQIDCWWNLWSLGFLAGMLAHRYSLPTRNVFLKSSHHLTDESKSLKTKYSNCFMVDWAIVDWSQCILKTVTRTSTVLLEFQKT